MIKRRTLKIEKSGINRYVDTAEWCYQVVCNGPPRELTRQNLKDGVYHQYFLQDTTRIASDYSYVEGLLTSIKTYWFNDTLQSEGKLVGGNLDGEWISYYPNGVVSSRFVYVRGGHNEFTFYFPTGVLKRHAKQREGRKSSKYVDYEDYYSNGQLMRKGATYNGFQHGEWFFYNRDGYLTEHRIFNHKTMHTLGPADWTE